MNKPFSAKKGVSVSAKSINSGQRSYWLHFDTMSMAFQPFPKRQILDSSKLKEFADYNFF